MTPFYCSDSEMTFDGGWYAIECQYVNIESGGRGGWTCNTYGVIDGPWGAFGGYAFASTACSASERDQSIVAARIWKGYGASAWAPFE